MQSRTTCCECLCSRGLLDLRHNATLHVREPAARQPPACPVHASSGGFSGLSAQPLFFCDYQPAVLHVLLATFVALTHGSCCTLCRAG